MQNRSHTAHRLQTTLTPAQEVTVAPLRKTLLLALASHENWVVADEAQALFDFYETLESRLKGLQAVSF